MSDYVATRHVKLISLEGGDGHVYRSVAGNHRRRRMMIAIEPPKNAAFVDEFINDIH